MIHRVHVAALILVLGLLVPAGRSASGAPAAQRFVIVPAESEALYRVNETFINEGNRLNTAVGRTSAVRGEIVVDRAVPRNSRLGPITVDISTFRSDSARRDRAIRERWLESARYPIAEFRAAAVEGLPAAVREGAAVRLRVRGDLTIREVTRPVTFDVTVTVENGTLRGEARTTIRMTDFGFQPPSILGILRAENEARLELRITARPAAP